MLAPRFSKLPREEENRHLRDRILRLEEELAQARGFPSGAERVALKTQTPVERYTKEIFDHTDVCQFLLDVTPDGKFRFAALNPAEEQAVGLSSSQVAGRFVEEVFSGSLSKKLLGNYRRCLQADSSISYEDELSLPAGPKYFHSNLIPLRNGAGRIYRILGVCTEKTDAKWLLEQATARQRIESLGVLTAGVAHDLINLIAGILSHTDLAESEMVSGVLPVESIHTIQTVATRAGEIVGQLSVFAGQDETTVAYVDLGQLVRKMLPLLTASVSKRVTLRVSLSENLPLIRADAVQLSHVVLNLFTNAAEAIGNQEGVISISISEARSGDKSLSDEPIQSDCLRLIVSDTGDGITEDVQPRIFDPFYSTKARGRGLGLAAVHRIVHRHRGSIEIASTPGAGSRFEILLPIDV